jgi:hypothetical protein
MRRLYLCATLAAVATLFAEVGTLHAQRVEAYISEDSVNVGDRFTLTLVAMHGFDETPSFPNMDSTFGDITPIRLLSAGTRQLDSDVRLDSAVYEVTTFALDTARLAPLTIRFPDSDVTATTPARELLVISVVPQDAEDIQGMAPPVGFGPPLWPFVLLGFALLITGALIWYMIWRRKNPKALYISEPEEYAPPDPATVALERLHALENAPLAERAQVEAFYVDLSDILRTYIEDRLHIPALECTTRELVQSLVRPSVQHQVPSGIPAQLEQVLSLADLVKFADVTPAVKEGRSVLKEAIKIIHRVEVKFGQRAAGEEFFKAS